MQTDPETGACVQLTRKFYQVWELPSEISYNAAIIGSNEIGFVRSHAFDWVEHCRPYAQILIPIGDGHCKISWRYSTAENRQIEHLRCGDACLIAPGVSQSGTWLQRTDLMSFFARPSFLDLIIGSSKWLGVHVVNLVHPPNGDPCIPLLVELCSQLSCGSNLSEPKLVEEIARSVTTRILRSHPRHEAASTGNATLFTSDKKAKILSFLNEALDNPKRGLPTVGDLARVAGLSPLHFSRVFKNTIGDSPKRYLIKCVMQRAAALVTSNEHRVEEVAAILGYSDPGYFSRTFRRFFGMPPRKYRELYRK